MGLSVNERGVKSEAKSRVHTSQSVRESIILHATSISRLRTPHTFRKKELGYTLQCTLRLVVRPSGM